MCIRNFLSPSLLSSCSCSSSLIIYTMVCIHSNIVPCPAKPVKTGCGREVDSHSYTKNSAQETLALPT